VTSAVSRPGGDVGEEPSTAQDPVPATSWGTAPRRAPKVVALGGGHGLYATLSALRLLTERVTAVVTVADDGGSSGRLRGELGVLPPGDLRMALAALRIDFADALREFLEIVVSGLLARAGP